MLLMHLVSIPIIIGVEILMGLQAANITELIVTILIYIFMTIQICKIILTNSQTDEKQTILFHIGVWCGAVLLFVLQNRDIIQKVF
jgi:riboflavin transporter FmnP